MPPYTKNVWADGDPTKPPSAARFNAMETGIERASPAAVSSTTLPGSPFDGQEVFYAANATLGVYWHLRYRSGSGSTHKWEALSGPPLIAEVLVNESTSSNTFVDLATVGPSVTVPLAGDYIIVLSSEITVATSGTAQAAVKLGTAATSQDEGVSSQSSAFETCGRAPFRRNSLVASAVLKMQYRSTGSTVAQFQRRNLAVYPVRVS